LPRQKPRSQCLPAFDDFYDAAIPSSVFDAAVLRGLFQANVLAGLHMMTGGYHIVEIERTLRKKLPRALPAWRRYRKLLELEIVPLPEWKEIERHRGTIADKDVPVIVSAIQGKCDLLVTGDRKDFGALARKSSLPFRIVTPAECVTQLGMWMEALGD
jgi:predicted nucleic acid-binding protein